MMHLSSQSWFDAGSGLFNALSLAIAQDPQAPVLLTMGAGLLFTMVADLGNAWSGNGSAREARGAFFTESAGPVAAHYERGNAYLSGGDTRRAIESFGKALRLNPTFAAALIGRGLALSKNGDYENAIADLSEALFLDPKNAKAYYLRGTMLGARGDYAGAITDYDCSLRIQPGQNRVREARGVALAKLGSLNG